MVFFGYVDKKCGVIALFSRTLFYFCRKYSVFGSITVIICCYVAYKIA